MVVANLSYSSAPPTRTPIIPILHIFVVIVEFGESFKNTITIVQIFLTSMHSFNKIKLLLSYRKLAM